jgi:hypothetical protein
MHLASKAFIAALRDADAGFPVDRTLLDAVSIEAEKYPNYKLSSDGDEWDWYAY